MVRSRSRLVFLSHATSDLELAKHVEDAIRAVLPGADVFRTSRTGQMPPGTGWFQQITDALYHADAFVVLITPRSQDRWWVLFEAGAALRSKKAFVPAVVGLTPDLVNEPLKYLTLRFLENPEEARQAFRELGGDLANPDSFTAPLAEMAERARRSADRREGWQFVEHPTGIYAWEGSFLDLPKGEAVPQPDDLLGLLGSAGLETTHGFLSDPVEGARGYTPVYFVKNGKQIHRVMRTDRQVLWVRPRQK